MPYLQGHGLRLFYDRAGSGPPLLIISGTGADLRVRPNVFDWPFAGHFEVVGYDQRGLGRSDTAPGPSTMADFADDAAAVLDEVGWDRAPVLGVSFGGMVAQELAIRHPARVSRLVLACTSSGGAGGPSYPLHELSELSPDERVARTVAVMDTRWADPHSARPGWVERLLSAPPPLDDGARGQLATRATHDTWDRLDGVRAPTLVCAGRYDGIAPPANSERLARRIPGAELLVFDGGHPFFVQDPTAFPAMIEFLAGPETTGPQTSGAETTGAETTGGSVGAR